MINSSNNAAKLDEQYWDNRWLSYQTGWDLREASPPISTYIDRVKDKDISILIPGCGNAYEAIYLSNNGFTNISLIDISKSLVEKLSNTPELKKCNIIHGDFFEHKGAYDLMLEQTFFCALHPSLRNQYVKHAHSLLKPGGILAGVLFDKQFEAEGPPFGGTKAEYVPLFQPYFDLLHFDSCTNSIAPRMGTELFIELRKK